MLAVSNDIADMLMSLPYFAHSFSFHLNIVHSFFFIMVNLHGNKPDSLLISTKRKVLLRLMEMSFIFSHEVLDTI